MAHANPAFAAPDLPLEDGGRRRQAPRIPNTGKCAL